MSFFGIGFLIILDSKKSAILEIEVMRSTLEDPKSWDPVEKKSTYSLSKVRPPT